MAKTKPYGVRFDTELLKALEEDGLAKTPQQAVNYLSSFWSKQSKIVNFEEKYGDFFKRMETSIQDLTKPNVEIKPVETAKSNFHVNTPKRKEKPANEERTVSDGGKHPLWKEGDPRENSAGFMMKYGCCNYRELEAKTD